MQINNSLNSKSGFSLHQRTQLAGSGSLFNKTLQQKSGMARTDTVNVSNTTACLTAQQISDLKNKYDVTNMNDEEFENLLQDLCGMGAIPPENATAMRPVFCYTKEEAEELHGDPGKRGVVRISDDEQSAPSYNKLAYFEMLCKQHSERGSIEADLLKNDKQLLDIFKLLA